VASYPWQEDGLEEQALVHAVQRRLERYIDLFAQASDSDFHVDLSFQHPATLAVLAAVILQITPQQKQDLLEIPSVQELLQNMAQLLRQENRALQIALASSHLHTKMNHSFSLN
jgi:ATP-dependent Lon protease